MVNVSHRSAIHPDHSTADGWHSYQCAHCGKLVNGVVVARNDESGIIKWLWCISCANGSVLTRQGTIFPGSKIGPEVQGLPNDIGAAYQEARDCFATNAFTACELICRKLLMHVAADKGAPQNQTFQQYLDFLESKNYITPFMKKWVDVIRKHGNMSAHELSSPDKKRAESTLMFTAELLKLIYEMEFLSNQYTGNSKT